MIAKNLQAFIETVYSQEKPNLEDIQFLLNLSNDKDYMLLFEFADKVRKKFVGDEVLLRGIIEFSNHCRNTCSYCGLNRFNETLIRYRLTKEQIMKSVKQIHLTGIKTVVLQSGEEDSLDTVWLKDIIETIKAKYDLAITLSVGERTFDEYALWRKAGADRYLLKIETSDPDLYHKLHPGMSYENRVKCIYDLKHLGYQTGSGNIIGLKSQEAVNIAQDILFFNEMDLDMISVSPFIPNPNTVLGHEYAGDILKTLKTLALTRIVTKNAHMPANTAIGSVQSQDWRTFALQCGANVVMPNFTPQPYRGLYEIYPNKICVHQKARQVVENLIEKTRDIDRMINFSKGDSVKLSGQPQ